MHPGKKAGSRRAIGVAVGLVVLAQAAAAHADSSSTTAKQCVDASEAASTARHAHSLIESRAKFLECAAPSCPKDIRTECAAQVDKVTADIPSVVFELHDTTGKERTDVTVTVDGAAWLASLDGTAQSVNPGSHRFDFSAGGALLTSRTLVIHEGEKSRHETISLATPASSASPGAGASTAVSTATTSDASDRAWQKPLAYGLGAVGIVGIGLGTYFGLHASSKKSSSESECASSSTCTNHAAAVSDHDSATSAASVSTVTFLVGGAALAAGLVLFFTAPPSSEAAAGTGSTAALRVTPLVGPGGAGMSVGGGF